MPDEDLQNVEHIYEPHKIQSNYLASRSPESLKYILKGRMAETLAMELFRDLGFFIRSFGVEHIFIENTQLSTFVSNLGANYSDVHTEDGRALGKAPDFVVLGQNGKTFLIEVKYRNSGIVNREKDYSSFIYYPCAIIVLNNGINWDNFVQFYGDKIDVSKKNEYLNSRFHVHYIRYQQGINMSEKSGKERIQNIAISPLPSWLLFNFELKYESTIKLSSAESVSVKDVLGKYNGLVKLIENIV